MLLQKDMPILCLGIDDALEQLAFKKYVWTFDDKRFCWDHAELGPWKGQFNTQIQEMLTIQDQGGIRGHIISKKGIQTNPTNVSVVKDWETPQDVKEVRSFLGIASY